MPKTIPGLDDTIKLIKQISPELYKELNAEIRPGLKELAKDAKQYAPARISGLSSWMKTNKDAKSRTSRARAFPRYTMGAARKGIGYRMGASRVSKGGWVSIYALFNRSAIGSIIETAGRKNPAGDPRSKSNNPQAGAHFIQAIQSSTGRMYRVGNGRKAEGRLIYRAVSEDNGMIRSRIIHAINGTIEKLVREAR